MSQLGVQRWWRLRWADVVPAAILLFIGLVGTGRAAEDQADTTRLPDLLAYSLVALAALTPLGRRHWPNAVVGICAAAVAAYLAIGYPFGPILLAGPVAVYGLAERVELRRAIITAGAFLVATIAAVTPRFLATDGAEPLGLLVWSVAWVAVVTAPAAVGVVVRTRRDAARAVHAEQRRRAESEERLRMARDLHDAVGHGLAVIAMQAGVALHVLDRDSARARESLEAIRSASREALQGLRVELEELRAPTGPNVETPAQPPSHGGQSRSRRAKPRRPNPDLADLPALVDRMRGGGLPITLLVDAGPDLPDDVAHAAYRIVQEALTNVLRHAEGAQAEAQVRRQPGALVVEVVDTGRVGVVGPASVGTGSVGEVGAAGGTGIEGMRARAEALGGELVAGPRPDGGYAVRAKLPIITAPIESAPIASGTPAP